MKKTYISPDVQVYPIVPMGSLCITSVGGEGPLELKGVTPIGLDPM